MALEELEEVPGVTSLGFVVFGRFFEPLSRELTDRLEHPEPLAGVTQQALVDQ